jgi:hemoglobin/transferrin/lactoferrin receptor protein
LNKTGLNNRIVSLDIFSLNADLTKNIGKHKLHYGLEGWYNKVESRAFTKDMVTGRIDALDTRYASGGAYMQSFAAYLTHTYEISDKIILNDGLRYSAVKLNAKFTDNTFFRFPFREATQINGAFTGNLGIVYLPGADFRLTALMSTGFRAPNVDDLSKVFESVPGTINVPNPGLKPEYTINSEIGVSKKICNKITVEATGYYTMYRNALTKGDFKYNGKDSILYEGVKSKVVSTTNAGKAYLYGMELGMHGQLNDNVSVYGTYNFTYGGIVSTPTIIPLDHIPTVFGKFGTEIKYGKFNSEVFVHYSGWKRIKDYNPFGEDNQAYALPEGMPSWYTLNARLTCQFNKIFNLQLACENLLDKNYRVFASNISAPGRNFIVTLRCDF